MVGKRKTHKTRGTANAELGQKEARLEKMQSELHKASEVQLSHMEGGNAAKAVSQQKQKLVLDKI